MYLNIKIIFNKMKKIFFIINLIIISLFRISAQINGKHSNQSNLVFHEDGRIFSKDKKGNMCLIGETAPNAPQNYATNLQQQVQTQKQVQPKKYIGQQQNQNHHLINNQFHLPIADENTQLHNSLSSIIHKKSPYFYKSLKEVINFCERTKNTNNELFIFLESLNILSNKVSNYNKQRQIITDNLNVFIDPKTYNRNCKKNDQLADNIIKATFETNGNLLNGILKKFKNTENQELIYFLEEVLEIISKNYSEATGKSFSCF
jgi:hypothetical protein